jgi:hypothetical protein
LPRGRNDAVGSFSVAHHVSSPKLLGGRKFPIQGDSRCRAKSRTPATAKRNGGADTRDTRTEVEEKMAHPKRFELLPPRLVVCDKVIDLAAPVSNSATRRSPSCLQICAIGGAWPPSSCSASIRKSPYCSQSKKIFLLVSFLADLTDRRPGAS